MAQEYDFRNFVHKLARFGCFAIGIVYVLVGLIAILSLLQQAQDDADEARMIDYVSDQPLGEVLIWIIIAGLLSYIFWRVFEAIKDPYNFGSDTKGLGHRAGIALSSLGYGLIAYTAIQILLGNGGDGDQERQLMVKQVLGWSGGSWLVGFGGVIMAAAGLGQAVYVAQGSYKQRLAIDQFSKTKQNLIHALAWAGYLARGVIMVVLGYFLIKGAVQHDASEVGDTDTAFDFIGGGIVGDTAFFFVALGTLAYGFLMFTYGFCYRFGGDKAGK